MSWPRFSSVAALKGKVDYAVITIKVEELMAVLDQFQCQGSHEVTEARAYEVGWMPSAATPDDPASAALVAITRCPTQGNGVGQAVARDIIDELDPQWLLVVGIGGGVPASEFSLGDVVLASRLLDFSVQAVSTGGTSTFAVDGRLIHPDVENYVTMVQAKSQRLGRWFDLTTTPEGGGPRIPLARPPVEVLADRLYGERAWLDKVKESLAYHATRNPQCPRVTAAPVGSSDRLVKDDALLSLWLKVARQVQVVEMESAGVYLATLPRGARKHYPAMSIRGISDIIGFKRAEAWTQYACVSAAAFANAFIRSSPIQVRGAGSAASRATALGQGADGGAAHEGARPSASSRPARQPLPPLAAGPEPGVPVFLLHAARDQESVNEFCRHLYLAKKSGLLHFVSASSLPLGSAIPDEVQRRFNAAPLILVFVGADLFTEHDGLVDQALRRSHQGTARVVPIMLSAYDMEGSGLRDLTMLPRDKPIDAYDSRENAWVLVARGIRELVQQMTKNS